MALKKSVLFVALVVGPATVAGVKFGIASDAADWLPGAVIGVSCWLSYTIGQIWRS